jgi:putative endonuclease
MVAGSNPVPRSKWFVYALQSERDDWLYIGMAKDVDRRLKEHNQGYNQSTKSRRPFKLIFCEECENEQEARAREKLLKSGSGREFLRGKIGR